MACLYIQEQTLSLLKKGHTGGICNHEHEQSVEPLERQGFLNALQKLEYIITCHTKESAMTCFHKAAPLHLLSFFDLLSI